MFTWNQYRYGRWTYGGEFINPSTGLVCMQLKYKGTKNTSKIRVTGKTIEIYEYDTSWTLTRTLAYDDYPYLGDIAAGIRDLFDFTFVPASSDVIITDEGHVTPDAPPMQVQLAHIPKPGTLYITSMTEVTFTPGPGQFRCDYATGILEFNPANTGQLFNANYTGTVAVSNFADLESKYLAIKDNFDRLITKPVYTDIFYQQYVTTVYDVLNQIPGIPLEFGLDKINPITIEQQIETQVKHLQNRLRLFFRPTIIKCDQNPYQLINEVGVNCDLLEPPYDGTDTNYLKLRYEPLIAVQRIELVYLGNLVRSYPFEWIQTNKRNSEVRIIPKTGSFHLMGMYSGSYLFHSFFPRSTSMNGLFLPWCQIDYAAGWEWGTLPEDISLAVSKSVAVWVLQLADGFYSPGLASKSIDGVSESYTRNAQTTLFGGRRKELQEEIKELLSPWRRIRMNVI